MCSGKRNKEKKTPKKRSGPYHSSAQLTTVRSTTSLSFGHANESSLSLSSNNRLTINQQSLSGPKLRIPKSFSRYLPTSFNLVPPRVVSSNSPLLPRSGSTVSFLQNIRTTIYGNNSSINGNYNTTTINNVSRDQVSAINAVNPLHLLWAEIKDVGGTHNSEHRFPPPQCPPEARQRVRQSLIEPIEEGIGSRVFWLSGPAGVGKSAIAQAISEDCEKKNNLVASFFFSKNQHKRNVPTYLFLTITYGLVSSVPELRDFIGHAIQSNPAILQSSLELQFLELIVKPCRWLEEQGEWATRPRLVVIDGLDECDGGDMQARVLSIISKSFKEHAGLPLQFFICSRPEPIIKDFFDSNDFHPRPWYYFLRNGDTARNVVEIHVGDGFLGLHEQSHASVGGQSSVVLYITLACVLLALFRSVCLMVGSFFDFVWFFFTLLYRI